METTIINESIVKIEIKNYIFRNKAKMSNNEFFIKSLRNEFFQYFLLLWLANGLIQNASFDPTVFRQKSKLKGFDSK